MSEKGQIVIPAEARKALGLKPGAKLLVFGRQEHGVLMLFEIDRVSAWVGQALAELGELSALVNGNPPAPEVKRKRKKAVKEKSE
jgi:AbrB family looped-hinge helix DNA binding protein